ncbi:MAG: prolyl oligopeptidase family serine peptidase [Bryobacteraceae bacterium]
MRYRLLAISVLVAVSAGAATFSLEQILSPAFPSELTASPAGSRVAWVLDAAGKRNIWVAQAPSWQGRAITAYDVDDGQEITALNWIPDGTAVLYVRGGAANRRGEIPNPTHDANGAEEAVWIVAAGGGQPRRLGEGSAPAVSPKGLRVAWVKAGQVWWAPADGSAKEAQLFKMRGTASGLAWSPDGASLAFVSDRGDHSFIGVFDVATKIVRFLDPSVDHDGQPSWSPDGTRIAFVRIPARKLGFMFGAEREGQPWSIRVASIGTGTGKEVWRAAAGRGSVFHGIVGQKQISWTNGRLIFPWEKDGWTHLYAIGESGGDASLLTPGAFEVEHVSQTPDGKRILFASNQGDINRRHIWSLTPGDGAPKAITTGKGIEWSPVMTEGGDIAFLRSNAVRPAHAAVLTGAETRELAASAIPAEFPSGSLVEPQEVTYSAADGLLIHGQLFLPRDGKPGDNRAALIFIHGGSRRQMMPGFHYMYYYHNTYAMNQYLASLGYVVLAINYRSGIGYGMEFREALNYGATGASEFQDVLGAGLYLRNRPEVDGKRIGLWGGSYGGYLTALGLSRASDLFAAGVDLHGVHDWNVVIRNFVQTYEPTARDEAKLAFDSSPMASVKDWRSPVLLIHGDDDRNVPFSETVSLAEQLRKYHVEFEQLIFPDEVHDFLRHENWLKAYHAAEEFLNRKLRK